MLRHYYSYCYYPSSCWWHHENGTGKRSASRVFFVSSIGDHGVARHTRRRQKNRGNESLFVQETNLFKRSFCPAICLQKQEESTQKHYKALLSRTSSKFFNDRSLSLSQRNGKPAPVLLLLIDIRSTTYMAGIDYMVDLHATIHLRGCVRRSWRTSSLEGGGRGL